MNTKKSYSTTTDPDRIIVKQALKELGSVFTAKQLLEKCREIELKQINSN